MIATPHANPGVSRAAAAHRAAGASIVFCIRFVVIHIALAPLTMLAVRRRRGADLGEPVEVVHGVTAIHRLPASPGAANG